jgi:hypothetical protein
MERSRLINPGPDVGKDHFWGPKSMVNFILIKPFFSESLTSFSSIVHPPQRLSFTNFGP